jgi:type I restriction enzyme M protein
MNKQQLANRIWESANKMRSKIEANEYKDYILGFIFYKFLSEKELEFLKMNDYTDDILTEVNEDDLETVTFVQKRIGYFISYNNLYSTWLSMGKDFDISNVRDALSAFSRLIDKSHKNVFDGIFQTLETGLSKLGSDSKSQSKAVRDLLHLIKDIPMDGKQDYDVLGFIYEYLISNFAANAGKKAGEFYTPHEVSELMSEIIAYHLKDRKEIKIYDPCSGSGSLLINIGKSVSKHMNNSNNIKYYAQELKENTYNLTRMNLVMRGIIPSNIVVRNGDTLEEDWPFFEDSNPIETYDPLYVDAVISNPPYSQKWDPSEKKHDVRFSDYGLAPKSKADYAFLLHDLYHVKPDGIMTIVLPHGVLFRGGEEGEIRKNLIEKNKIDAIIGLPANIFFGTGIPTIIMVLKQKRKYTDTLIIDASKGFVKEGKNNKLRACDIKRITDAIKYRKDIEKFCRVVSREEIRRNDYNLNIPRYVDSSEKSESWDIYASMFGGIPNVEIDELHDVWNAFPTLKTDLFYNVSSDYSNIKVDNIKNCILNNSDVKKFISFYIDSFKDFDKELYKKVVLNSTLINISKTEEEISEDIFKRLKDVPLIDSYEAYQLFKNEWMNISIDLEIIQTEGFDSTKIVDANMVIKKKDNKDVEVQEGWVGRILPFELVQEEFMKDQLDILKEKETKINDIVSYYSEAIDLLSEDDKENLLNDDDSAFLNEKLKEALEEIQSSISTPVIEKLQQYLMLKTKKEKLSFIKNSDIGWENMTTLKDGTFSQKEVKAYISRLKSEIKFEENSREFIINKVVKNISEEKILKKEVKTLSDQIHLDTKKVIENLDDDQVNELLKIKWINSLISNLNNLPIKIINNLVLSVEILSKKYAKTYAEIDKEINNTEKSLISLIDQLTGDEFDMLGLEEFKSLLGGK